MPEFSDPVPVFRHAIVINCPVEAAFAAVADVHTHPRWQSGLLKTEAEGTVAHPGARGVEIRKLFGRVARFPYEITVFAPPRRWGFRALDGPVQPSAVLTFEPIENGTRVSSELTVPGALGWILPIAAAAAAEQLFAPANAARVRQDLMCVSRVVAVPVPWIAHRHYDGASWRLS
jgi:uncharacterized protein YndB with AHSA1/START domain